MSNLKKFAQKCSGLILLISSVIMLQLSPLLVNAAPSSTNKIGLTIMRVRFAADGTFDNKIQNTAANAYEYNDKALGPNDEIRYSWKNTAIDIANANSPKVGAGYLKIYANDDSTPDNFITNYGSSPLVVKDIASKLKMGRNTILLVYTDQANAETDPLTKVQFSFNYQPDNIPEPSIEIVSPASGSVLGNGLEKDFQLKLNNFNLEKDSSNQINYGHLNLYYNEINNNNLINTFTSATQKTNYSELTFNSKDFAKFANIPDSTTTKLIFALTDSNGKLLNKNTELQVITNYNNSVETGLPNVKIMEPQNKATITSDYKIKVQVNNFNLLPQIETREKKSTEGYLQVRVDDKVVKEATNQTEFTLNSLGVDKTGQIKIRVDLVNTQFEQLDVPANAEILVNVKQNAGSAQIVSNSSNNWRIIVMIITIVLVVGSIVILVTKG